MWYKQSLTILYSTILQYNTTDEGTIAVQLLKCYMQEVDCGHLVGAPAFDLLPQIALIDDLTSEELCLHLIRVITLL